MFVYMIILLNTENATLSHSWWDGGCVTLLICPSLVERVHEHTLLLQTHSTDRESTSRVPSPKKAHYTRYKSYHFYGASGLSYI